MSNPNLSDTALSHPSYLLLGISGKGPHLSPQCPSAGSSGQGSPQSPSLQA